MRTVQHTAGTHSSPAPLKLTIITSERPDRLTKVLSLAPDGTLQKQAAANMLISAQF